MKRITDMTGIRRQVGWFIIIGIGAVLLLLAVISVRTDIFANKFELYVSPPSATAFFIGQEVKFQGFPIGRVHNIELLPHGRVHVSLHLLERYHTMLHEGAAARLIKEGVIGQQTVEITAGMEQAAILRNRAFIPYHAPASVDQLLIDLKPSVANAGILLDELVKLAKWLNDPDGDVRQVTASLRRASEGMDSAAVRRVIRTMSNSGEEIQKLTHHLNDISPDLKALAIELPGLVQESKSTIAETRQLMQGLRSSWLLGGRQTVARGENVEVAPLGVDLRP